MLLEIQLLEKSITDRNGNGYNAGMDLSGHDSRIVKSWYSHYPVPSYVAISYIIYHNDEKSNSE